MGAHAIRLAVLTVGLLATGLATGRDIVAVGLMADRAIFKIDGQTRLVRVGETVDDLTLVSVSASEAVVKVGQQSRRLTLGEDHGGLRQADAAGGGSVEINGNAMGQFVTSGMINGRVVQFLVDTGANTVSMSRNDAKRLGIDFRQRGEAAGSSTANGVVKSWRILLDKVKVGPIVVTGVDASVRDTDDDLPILLGMSFLGRIRMEHDQNRLILTGR